MKQILHGFIKASVLAGVICTGVCSAAVLLGTPSATGTTFGTTIGADFTVGASPISVTQLGAYDNGANGLAISHQVGLWDISGTLLRSVTIQSGTASPLTGTYRYEAVTPVLLTAGASYTIGALFPNTSDVAGQGGSASIDPAIASANVRRYYGDADQGTLNRPDRSTGLTEDVWAANMQFSVVPEPGLAAAVSSSLMVMVAGAFEIRRRRKLSH